MDNEEGSGGEERRRDKEKVKAGGECTAVMLRGWVEERAGM